MPDVAVTPTVEPIYEIRGRWIYIDDERAVWAQLVTEDGRTWIELDPDTGPVYEDGRDIRIGGTVETDPKLEADYPGYALGISTTSTLVANPNRDRKIGILYNPTAEDMEPLVPGYLPATMFIRLGSSDAVVGNVAFPLEPGQRWDYQSIAVGISAYHDGTGTKYLWRSEV